MPASPATLRRATLRDASACASVHHTSWKETYSALLPASHWDDDTLERRTASWKRWLSRGTEVTVAVVDGRIVGFAMTGRGRQVGGHEAVRARELYSLYVLAAHHGSGVGQRLLDAVLSPETPAQLWVAERNPRARRFYERNGFLADGARFVDEQLDFAEVRLVR